MPISFRSHCQPESLDHTEVLLVRGASSGRSPSLRSLSMLLTPIDSQRDFFIHHMTLVVTSDFIIKIRDCGFK